MANIQNKTVRRKSAGVAKCKKHSTRVDLTPMVDLGFLLLTFFIFTTSMTTPNALRLTMPIDSKDSTPIGKSDALNVIVNGNKSIYYYAGDDITKGLKIADKELRNVIIQQKKETGINPKGESKLVVLIKAGNDAAYADVMHVINEMLINDVRRYMLLDPSKFEISYITREGF